MSSPTCSIQHRPDLHLIVARWSTDAPFAQLQADYRAVLELSQQQQAPHWLLDVRRRDDVAPEWARWTTEEFLPLAARQLLPAQLRIAVLASPARLIRYDEEAVLRTSLDYGLAPYRPYRLQLFNDEGQAMQWLAG